tara:strand:- start:539 stop:922 length:384 start_codon:yes stop_codon:yes gene_type:complete
MPNLNKLPKTADGEYAHNGMKVWECSPYSVDKAVGPYTIHHILGGDDESDKHNGPWFVLTENMHMCDRCGDTLENGNTEHYTKMYADPEKAMIVANEKYAEFLKDQEQREQWKRERKAKLKERKETA